MSTTSSVPFSSSAQDARNKPDRTISGRKISLSDFLIMLLITFYHSSFNYTHKPTLGI